MAAISGVIVTKNEADRILACIESLRPVCKEILVIDSFSTDGTQILASKAGAKVIERAFNGFGEQKQFAVDEANYDWVLVIDADEVLSPELQLSIQSHFQGIEPAYNGFYLPRTFVFMGRKMLGGGEEKKKYLRLFHKEYGRFTSSSVHENVELNGQAEWLKGSLFHFSYRNLHHYFQKFNQYTSLAADELSCKGKKKSGVYLYLRFGIGFWQYYLLKGFYKDGFPGFVWSICSAFYPIVKYAKTREIIEAKEFAGIK